MPAIAIKPLDILVAGLVGTADPEITNTFEGDAHIQYRTGPKGTAVVIINGPSITVEFGTTTYEF